MEYLGRVVFNTDGLLYPDSVVGTDSHTTMIDGLGVAGWGVGGIEAEAAMLGQVFGIHSIIHPVIFLRVQSVLDLYVASFNFNLGTDLVLLDRVIKENILRTPMWMHLCLFVYCIEPFSPNFHCIEVIYRCMHSCSY